MKRVYCKKRSTVKRQIAVFSCAVIILIIGFRFLSHRLSYQNLSYLAIIAALYIYFLAGYLRQFHYKLTIDQEMLQIENDLYIANKILYWKDISKIKYIKFRGIYIKPADGEYIFIGKDIINYMEAWGEIVINTKANCPNVIIPPKLPQL